MKINISRTDNMAPSDISRALWDGTLQLCHKMRLRPDQINALLRTMLWRGWVPGYQREWPKTLTILKLGISYTGEPLALVSIAAGPANSGDVRTCLSTEHLCKHCPYEEYCSESGITSYEMNKDTDG